MKRLTRKWGHQASIFPRPKCRPGYCSRRGQQFNDLSETLHYPQSQEIPRSNMNLHQREGHHLMLQHRLAILPFQVEIVVPV
jgi:hypothetical protein